jgi:hypothetical protein
MHLGRALLEILERLLDLLVMLVQHWEWSLGAVAIVVVIVLALKLVIMNSD